MVSWKKLGRSPECPSGIGSYLYSRDTETLWLWLRGTRGRKEWRWNFSLRRTLLLDGKKIKVNVRDFQQADAVLKELIETGPDGPIKELAISGDSRGGGVASVLGWLFRQAFPDLDVHYPLGLFAAKRSLSRIPRSDLPVNKAFWQDPVPWLPPWPWGVGFPMAWRNPKDYKAYWPSKGLFKAHRAMMKVAARFRHAIQVNLNAVEQIEEGLRRT